MEDLAQKIEWQQDGGLLYSLKDGVNHFEVNVTMAAGSRDVAERSKFAGTIREAIRTALPVAQGEAVAWGVFDGDKFEYASDSYQSAHDYARGDDDEPHLELRPLYAAPPAPAPEAQGEAVAVSDSNRLLTLASGLVDDLDNLMGESSGVYGLHLNGDGAPWNELVAGGQFERLTHLDDLRDYVNDAQNTAPPASRIAELEREECEYEFTVLLDGEFAAMGSASDPASVLSEADRYAAQYAMDGAVEVEFSVKRGISRDALEALAAQEKK